MPNTESGTDTYTYGYDTRGNMISMPHLSAMAWNMQNELYRVTWGTNTTYYQYSGGQRIRKYTDKGAIKEERIYLGSWELYRKFEGSSLSIERQTVHISDDTGRIAMLEKRMYGSAADDHNTEAELVRYIYSNHLQSASLELDHNGNIISYEEYQPYGTTSYQATNASINAVAKRYRYTGKERDEESGLLLWCTLLHTLDMPFYKCRPVSREISCLFSIQLHSYNPINLIDPDGREPIKPYVGTAAMFRALLNNSPSKVGGYKGDEVRKYLLNLGHTEMKGGRPTPTQTQTGYFNMKKGRYVYTKKGGWIDMTHFLFYAGTAYKYKEDGRKNPIGDAVQDGYRQEASDAFFAPHSAFSYEDLPSDKFGAEFAINHFDPESDLTFGEQVYKYLTNVLGATTPENAPNFNNLPESDNLKEPTRINRTTQPLFIEGDDGTIGQPIKILDSDTPGRLRMGESKF